MEIEFPKNPQTGDTYRVLDKSWTWNGFAWDMVPVGSNIVDDAVAAADQSKEYRDQAETIRDETIAAGAASTAEVQGLVNQAGTYRNDAREAAEAAQQSSATVWFSRLDQVVGPFDDNTPIRVTNDPNDSTANRVNGLYLWNAATSTPVRVAETAQPTTVDSLYDFSRLATLPWLSQASLVDRTPWYAYAQSRIEGALAIKEVYVENPDLTKEYLLGILCNNHPTNLDLITIFDKATGTSVASTGITSITKNPNGLTRVVLGNTTNINTTRFILYIDYREITTTGVVVNGSSTPLVFARSTASTQRDETTLAENTPVWVHPEFRTLLMSSAQRWRNVADAIEGVWLNKGTIDPAKRYRFSVVVKDDLGVGVRILIGDGTGVNVAGYETATPAPVGTTIMALTERGGSGISGYVAINWEKIIGPLTVTSGTSNLVINPAIAYPQSAVMNLIPRVDSLEYPKWLAPTAVLTATEMALATKIQSLDLLPLSLPNRYNISVITRHHATLGDRIFVRDQITGSTVAQWDPPEHHTPSATGIDILPLVPWGSSGVSGVIAVRWRDIPVGTLYSASNGNIIIDTNRLSDVGARASDKSLEEKVKEIENLITGMGVTGSSNTTEEIIRQLFMGSSITWGRGWLGQISYVGVAEYIMRTRYAETKHASMLTTGGTAFARDNAWLGEFRRISGVGSAVEFTNSGDELTINICRERGNAGASLIDLFIDGVLFDTFSTYNDLPYGTNSETFSGNGVDVKFLLSQAFTYNHTVTVGGVAQVGGMNSQVSGASIPEGWDYMVTRAYNPATASVVHQVWFRNAPTGAVVCGYSFGESVTYMRGTVGNVGVGLDSVLESSYGDGAVSEDTTAPASVSSGLGFRDSDPRACVTYMLAEKALRNIRLVVKSLDPRATGTTPWLDLNFVTNRMHHVMNAGIGGWTSAFLLNTPILINRVDEAVKWGPTSVLLESCTNDDWLTHVAKGWVTRTGLTAAQLKEEASSNYFNDITGTASNKTVQDIRLPITGVTINSVTVNRANATITAEPGDALIIGDFRNDHRRVAVRIVKSYSDGVFTFAQPIQPADFAQLTSSLSGLVGETCMVKSAPAWESDTEECMNRILEAHPDCTAVIATAGQPNFNHRRLLGYRELGKALAHRKGWGFVDFYEATGRFTYTQPRVSRAYIASGSGTTSTGAQSYPLTTSGGAQLSSRLLPNVAVKVNGVELPLSRWYVTGGYSYTWASNVTNPTLANDSLLQVPYRLHFIGTPPASGATIEVFYANKVWSTDSTHPGNLVPASSGLPVFGNAASKAVAIASRSER